jgi:hypothetical protein
MTEDFNTRPTPEPSGVQWQAVDSSQIEALGYEDGATYPLAIHFPPTKKQKAAEQPGSIYRYANVTREQLEQFVAAKTNPDYDNSIGVFFGRVIKSRPDLYPYVKVEADTAPADPTIIRDIFQAVDDTPSPSTSIAALDTLAPEVLFTPGNVDPILVKLREQVLDMAKGLDPSTPAKQKRIRDVKGLVASQRIFVEKVRKGYVADLVAKKGLTDKVSNAIQGRLSDIESEILEVTGYAAWEQGEKEFESRMTGLQNRLANMGKEMHLYASCAAIEEAIKELEEYDTSETREHKQAIEGAIAASLRVLKPELAGRQEAERNWAELAELRRKQTEREEADRQAEASQMWTERVKAAVEAERKRAADAAAAEYAAMEARAAGKVIDKPDSGLYMDIGADKLVPVQRYSSSNVPVEESVKYATTMEALEALKAKIHRAAAEAMKAAGINDQEADTIVSMIAEGLIPHIAIVY